MSQVVHFNMIVEINQLFKKKNLNCSIHAIGSCTCSGLKLKGVDKTHSVDEIVEIINEYLESRWLRVRKSSKDDYVLNVESKFDFEK